MPNVPVELSRLKAACEAIVKGGERMFKWEWDGRFHAALSPFREDDRAAVHALLERTFPGHWDIKTIEVAAPVVRDAARFFGGLRAGQELFVMGEDGPVIMSAAWWPWGSGDTISIRIKPLTKEVSEPEERRLVSEFRGWFGL
ncbi:MAG TPA: hypothetical protein VGW35_12320 [Methylomirabilota bacterium]|nr:hypothetical protein [Methylomirabilota bacterium]